MYNSKYEPTTILRRSSRILLPILLLITLASCAQLPASAQPTAIPNSTAQPTTAPTNTPATLPTTAPANTPATLPIALDGWRMLYKRANWDGGATVDLRAVGDIMLGRLVGTIARKNGLDYPFAQARQLLAGDLAIGNLESPLTDRRSPLRPGPYRLPASPDFAEQLRAAGFRALSLANNHALDVGPGGLSDAATAISTTGIFALGVGPDTDVASAPAFITANGLRIALLGFNDVHDPEDQADEGAAWGRAWLGNAALDRVRQARGQADLVVVVMHWGQEYATQPTTRQRAWAGKLIGAGADLIIGAHPHVLQPTEQITAEGRSGFVAYSLGNFIFDQHNRADTSTSTVLRILLDHQGVALVAAAPIEIVAGQARPLAIDSAPAQAVLTQLAATAPLANNGTQTPAARSAPTPIISPTSTLHAWSWDGKTASPVAIPPNTQLAARPARIPADLRGDGQPLWVNLDAHGTVELRDDAGVQAPIAWPNQSPDWRVTRVDAGDLDDDGRIEALLLLWKADGSHPFLVGWRGGQYRVIWGGSATKTPMQDVTIGDLDGDGRQELVVLEGGRVAGDPAQAVSIWRWNGWMFDRKWRAAVPNAHGLALQDVSGDGHLEIVVSSQ